MTQIWERLFIGGLADAEGLVEANPHGINTGQQTRTIGASAACNKSTIGREGTMNQAQREMEEAVADWLQCHQGHERYLAATENLFEVFARSWQGSRRYVTEAFTDFREALLRNSGYSHVQVTEVFPMRKPKSE
jgi:hypothetical protein